jgi:hypothetical protein
MPAGVNSVATGAASVSATTARRRTQAQGKGGADDPKAKALEARRQEILQSAQAQGGAQARAVRTGSRNAAAQPSQTAASAPQAQGQTGAAAPQGQASPASNQSQPAQSKSPGAGWRDRIKRWDAPSTAAKGTAIDAKA